MGMSDYLAGKVVDIVLQAVATANLFDNAASSPLTNLYLSLHTAYVSPSSAQNTSECSYTGYARQAVSRSASGWTRSSRTTTNDNQIQFGQRTDAGSAQEAIFWCLGDASSGASNVYFSGAIGATRKLAIGNDTSGETIVAVSHGYSADDRVVFVAPQGSSLPTGLTEGTPYYVRSGGLTTDAFTVSATQGGAAVNITGTGNAYVTKLSPVSITQNINPTIAASALSIVV